MKVKFVAKNSKSGAKYIVCKKVPGNQYRVKTEKSKGYYLVSKENVIVL